MNDRIKRTWEWILILAFSGYLYVCMELVYRGTSDITMMFCASICVVPMFALNEWFTYEMNFFKQIFICSIFCTIVEFIFGLIFNMDYHIWDYRNMPLNIMGLVCPQFMVIWAAISAAIIPLMDFIDYYIFNEGEAPYYVLTKHKRIYMKF